MSAGLHAALRRVSYVESLQVSQGPGQSERERSRRTSKHADVESYFTAQPGTPVRCTQSKWLRQYEKAQPTSAMVHAAKIHPVPW